MDLADIARQLDEDERDRMAEGDVTSQDYQEFLKVWRGSYYYFTVCIKLTVNTASKI